MSEHKYPYPYREAVFKRLFNRKYKKILDVGASKITINLLKKYFPESSIIGINIKRSDDDPLEIKLGNAEHLDFKNELFDLIFCQETLEHIIYPDKFINEAKRVLKNGGDIIIDTPNLNCWSNRILLLLGYPPTNYTPYPQKTPGVPKFLGITPLWDHPRVFPYKTLKEIFNSNGFKLKKMVGVNESGGTRKFKRFRWFVEKFLPNSWRDVIILKSRVEK